MKIKNSKDYKRWFVFKKRIDQEESSVVFQPRDVWWCSIGVNVGREQQSQTDDFSRPVIVVRRFTPDIFWGIPLTSKVKDEKFRYRFVFNGLESDALIFHMRSYDRKRLVRKIGVVSEGHFKAIKDLLVSSL
jgi:mRNA interferase MazF